MQVCQKSHVTLIFLMFGKKYRTIKNWQKQKKTVPNIKTCV